MRVRQLTTLLLLGASVASGTACAGCSKKSEPSPSAKVEFSKVPLNVQLPAGWRQAQNSTDWLVYRPASEGAFVAMSGERSCSLVEKRLYSALIELGLDQVVWQTAPRITGIQGLSATVAEGTAMEATHPSRLKYSLVRAKNNMGCLVTLVGYWQSKEAEFGAAADQIVRSVEPQK